MSLNFTLLPSAADQLAEALLCLSRFSDTVSFEARDDRLALIALNAGKSAYACFTFDRFGFFDDYDLTIVSKNPGEERKYTFSVAIKALLPAFKFRHPFSPVPAEGKNLKTTSQSLKWLISLEDRSNGSKCRFVVKVVGNGVTKTHKLTYEASEIMHALFNKGEAINSWTIYPRILKEYSDFFGPKAEQLDIYLDDDETVHFVSFTEKILNAKKEVLKHPLKTTVSLAQSEFVAFHVIPRLHIIISVKDFRTIIAHASVTKSTITAMYSHPTRPLQFAYQSGGMKCQFTLMTAGSYEGTTPISEAAAVTRNNMTAQARPPNPTAHQTPKGMVNAGPIRHAGKETPQNQEEDEDEDLFGLPSVFQLQARPRTAQPFEPSTASRSQVRKLGQAKSVFDQTAAASIDTARPSTKLPKEQEGLFVPEDEDRQWDPPEYSAEEWLGWDASADLNITTSLTAPNKELHADNREANLVPKDELAPATQQASQIRGLW